MDPSGSGAASASSAASVAGVAGATSAAVNLPDDPNAKIYLKICFVCGASAKPGQDHLRNYGAVVCFSCRAFWRRCYQNASSPPAFACRGGFGGNGGTRSNTNTNSNNNPNANCYKTNGQKRNCKRCRHARCLLAGMNPAAVLSDDQKKERFKKLFKRRQRMLAREAKLKGAGPKWTRARTLASAETSGIEERTEAPSRPRRRRERTRPEDGRTSGMSVDALVEEHARAQQETRCQRFRDVEARLRSLRDPGTRRVVLTREEVAFLMDALASEFRTFSAGLSTFQRVPTQEQVKILDATTPLYVQLSMGQYLMVDRVQEMPDVKKSTKKSWMTSFMQKQFLEELCKKTNLFHPNADLDHYARLIVKLKGLPELNTPTKSAVIAFTLTDPAEITNPEVVDLYNTHLRLKEDFLDLSSLVEVLKSMAQFCSEFIIT